MTVVHGAGSFDDPHTIRVRKDGERDRLLRGETILITTGSRPQQTPDVSMDGRLVLDSDNVL